MDMNAVISLFVAAVVLASGCVSEQPLEVANMGDMTLSSPSFADNGDIPAIFTCQGDDTNPQLDMSRIPESSRSLALIMDDPDAPTGTWDHWVVFNMDPATGSIAEGSVPDGAVQGRNSWGRNDYGGPCPPSGTHRYVFSLYALDTVLSLGTPATKADVLSAMRGHVLAKTTLTGLYGKG